MAFRDFFREHRDRDDEERRWRAREADWREQQGRWGGRRAWPPGREWWERRPESSDYGRQGYPGSSGGERRWPERSGRPRYEPESYGRWGREEQYGRGWREEQGEGRGPYYGGRYYPRGGGMAGREAGRMWGEGGYGEDIEYGRRGALGYGGYGRVTGRELTWRERGGEDHRGKGPSGYRRSDERIREDVCDSLMEDPRVDASNMEVAVNDGEVTLSGHVSTREEKRWSEDLVARIGGVRDVNNTLRVAQEAEARESGESPGARH